MDKTIIGAATFNTHMDCFSTQGPDFLDADESLK